MLNIPLIQQAQQRLGLTGKAIGDACGVSKEAVSNWLKGESLPRPSKLVSLAHVLQLDVESLVVDEVGAPEPVIAYRTRHNRPPSAAVQQAGEEVGRHLRQLLPLVPGRGVLANRAVAEPRLTPECIATTVDAVRSLLSIEEAERVTHRHLLDLFRHLGVVLIPVFWGGDREGHENAMSVYLPDSKTTWVLFNLGCRIDDFSYWLAHELGHALTLHALRGDDGEEFAEQFAQRLLFPDIVARQALEAIREERAAGRDPMAKVAWFAGKYEVSVVAVVKAADRVAAAAGEPITGLESPRFYAHWRSSRRSVPTVAQQFFGTDRPAALEYITRSEELFGTTVFKALAEFQRSEGRSPAFIAETLNINVSDAAVLSEALGQSGG